jgi:CheY-like chemotaxis protein
LKLLMTPPLGYLFTRVAWVAVDEPRVAEAIREALARAGYRTELRAEGERRSAPSFLALDGDLERVRGLRAGGNGIPVILLSGQDASTALETNVGVVERLFVPFTPESLRRAISRVSQND